MGVELRHLRYFVAVAEALNFRRAAERLHVAQPALSKQIKDLEGDVGAKLLHRSTGGVMLTDAGTVFLDEARDILERVDMAVSAARDAATGHGGRLIVGNLGALSAAFLPATLSAFRARHPQVEVHLHEVSINGQIEALQAGRIHVGFGIDRGDVLPPAFERVLVMKSRIAVALGRDHPMARQSVVSLADLASESLLSFGETETHNLHRQRIQEIFSARGIRHRAVRRVNSYESLIAMIAGDHGVSMMLPMARKHESIVYRRIKEDGKDLQVSISVIWRKVGESSIARSFVEILREVCASCRDKKQAG